LDLDLLVEPAAPGYRARVTDSPSGEAATDFQLPFSRLEIENFILKITGSVGASGRRARRLESPERQLARSFGSRLFQAVFSRGVGDVLHSSLQEALRVEAGLRIRLHLADAPELADLPWEFLYDPSLKQPLGLSGDAALVRYLDLPVAAQPLAVSPPIRILVMISSPADLPQLDVAGEWDRICGALSDLSARGLVSLTRLSHASLASLQRPLRHDQYHVFHFVGHGGFDEQSQDGALVLEDGEGRARLVTGQDLGVMLSGHHTLRLAVLNSCEGARGSVSDPFSGIAQSLVQQGIPAVVAMQFEISDQAAIIFAQELYAALADGSPVDAAVGECRRAIFAGGNDVEWATPVLYMRSPDGQLFQVRDGSSSSGRAPAPGGPTPEAIVLPDLAESKVGPGGGQASGLAVASLAPTPAEPPGVDSSPRRAGRLRVLWLTVALAVLAGAGVLIADLATSSSGHSSSTVGTTISVTSHGSPTLRTGEILSEGTASLSDPTRGFDLLTGRSEFFAQSTMAWDGSQLSIFDETTLGAANLGRRPFDNVGLATLQPQRYGRGSANPPLGASDIPAGDVLAIHLSDTTYAKIEILGIDANDALHFRWVTYGTTST
jgi:hypothetical protein